MAAGKKRKSSHKKHCSSKREVFQMVQQQFEEKHPEKRAANTMGQQLRTINQLKPIIAAAKEKMRAGGQRA